ncbi:MAG TPA: thiol reductant ABC exporter subunit CydC [Chloroflexi bacterium]|nr:thiol reductant ABC exporter subunit CydC [Chloroflexota bacterium]
MSTRQVLRRLLGLVWPESRRVLLAVILGTATVLSGVGLLGTGAYLIARAALRPPLGALQVAVVGVRFFGIARGVFRYAERLVSHDTTFRVLTRLRVGFYAALEPLAPARLQAYRSGDLLARIVGDIRTLEHFFVRVLAPPLVAALTALLIGGFLGTFSPAMGWAWLGCFLLAAVVVPVWVRRQARTLGPRLVATRGVLNATLVDSVQGLADVLVSGHAPHLRDEANRAGDRLLALQARLAALEGIEQALQVLLSGLGMLAVLVLGIPLVRSGGLEGVVWVALVLMALSSFEAAMGLSTAASFLDANLAAARRLFTLVEARPEVQDPPTPRPLPAVRPVLRLEGVWFRYTPEDPWVLQDLSLTLEEGKRIAVVGPSGAGKSTLIALLLRFWDYQRGRVWLNGHDLREYAVEDLRRLFAVVAQRPFLFSGTIRENLLLARPDATPAMLDEVTRQAQLYEFIHSLPQGYDTDVGAQGVQLSGGQRQRLALAQALLREAPFFLLDEPTANLDALTERALVDVLLQATQGRGVLWVTHRLVGLEAMDEIVVLHQGCVAQRGSHTALLAEEDGLYARMARLQQQRLHEHIRLHGSDRLTGGPRASRSAIHRRAGSASSCG